jgi:formiminotetrahydrofolate cyclodeaminase
VPCPTNSAFRRPIPGTGALLGHAGLKAAGYNVRINLPSITDEAFRADVRGMLDGFLKEGAEVAARVEAKVEETLGRKG